MAKVMVKVNIGDNENNAYNESVKVEINSIDYVVIKDNMDACSSEEFDASWERLVRAILKQRQVLLPLEWYINGEIEFLEKVYENT